MVQSWAVLASPAAISTKALQLACSFLTNEDEEDDEIVALYPYDPSLEETLGPHLKKEHIQNAYEPILIRARSAYEVTGPSPLTARFVALEAKKGSGDIGLRTCFLEHCEQVVKPDMIFVGSFGAGGKKIDEYGTISDGVARLARCSVCIVKNTWPAHGPDEPAKFVMACDAGASSLESAWLLRRLIKPKDTMECVLVTAGPETDKEREIIEKLKRKLATARAKEDQVATTFHIVSSDSLGKESIARTLCAYAQRADADFLVTGSQGATGTTKRAATSKFRFGEVTALCANLSRTHFIVMKPEFVYATPQAAADRFMKRSGSFMGKMQMLGGEHV